MKSLSLALILTVLVAILLSGCCSTLYPDFCGLEMADRFTPFPKAWKEAFYEMRGEYVAHYWDCDDMTQVYAEYLFEQGVDWKDMRVVAAVALISLPDGTTMVNPMLGQHAWLEVRLFGKWWVFDMAGRKFAWKFNDGKRPGVWAQYTIFQPTPGGQPLWDGSGYRNIGDRFDHERLVWVSKDGEEFSVESRTDEAHRKEVSADLEALRRKRAESGSSTKK